MMEGMASLGQIFKEFNDTLNEYQSQSDVNNGKSHVVDSSCLSNESFEFFRNFNARISQGSIFPQVKIKMEKTVHYMEVCLQDKIRNSTSKFLTEMCLQKYSLKSVLKDSKANEILGHVDSERGDRINCSLTTRKIQKETHEKHTKENGTESSKENEMTHSKSLSGTFIRSSMDEHNAFPNGGWFACGVSLGLFLSSVVFVFVWFRKSLAQRKTNNIRRGTATDRKTNVSSCYMDIDQYELIPIYKDPAFNNRFTKPAFAEHVPHVKSKADPETEGGLGLHRVNDTAGKEQPDEHYRSPSECTSEYHLLEKQNSTSEKTAGLEEDQPYFLLEENDTSFANRDVDITIALDNERKVLHTEK
nr:uncharacterized protein LOC111107185 isoform X3 [Crassostrea virginica]XP_022297943.1 uncharacterized protein LOC111107185 isoform X3 [Crassostrea virginica]XP_022297944.1 uncharacterized protein LOC111107185 isoform X3 [Crassostrea virginica]XP_022297945.1 uncharacterized protein LOC111107185 isoform X3 [Crassostrea virginica]